MKAILAALSALTLVAPIALVSAQDTPPPSAASHGPGTMNPPAGTGSGGDNDDRGMNQGGMNQGGMHDDTMHQDTMHQDTMHHHGMRHHGMRHHGKHHHRHHRHHHHGKHHMMHHRHHHMDHDKAAPATPKGK